MIEDAFDVPFVAAQALREKQVQQTYRPIIQVHKWFARRPGTLFRSLLLAEFGRKPLSETFYQANDLSGISVCDPFMGGGGPLLEANRTGADITGYDINPMAWWIVNQEINDLDLVSYQAEADRIKRELTSTYGKRYTTTCVVDGSACQVKYLLWVKTTHCPGCEVNHDLMPGYLVAEDIRHPKNVVACRSCGELNEVVDLASAGNCRECRHKLAIEGTVSRGKATCPACKHVYRFSGQPTDHRLFAIEYANPNCESDRSGRFFKRPDKQDLANAAAMEKQAASAKMLFVPDDRIPVGDETNRLLKWGYTHWRQLFNGRQLVVLNSLATLISQVADERIRGALATNFSDLLRYQNLLCRYDTMALKSLDVFSVHGFPVGYVSCESNILGVVHPRTGANIGSGGWSNITTKFVLAKKYGKRPFEIIVEKGKKREVPIDGERISDIGRRVTLRCQDSTTHVGTKKFDAVFTDPPYFGMVQYAELMDFCYIWLRKLVKIPEFAPIHTRNDGELTGNRTQGRGLDHFAEGVAKVFAATTKHLAPGGPLAFTFHHNKLPSYAPIAMAVLDAGLTCSDALPCPAEMGGSIHISGTGSSIVDTVFVCRTKVAASTKRLASPMEAAKHDVEQLAKAMTVSAGDARCILFGRIVQAVIRMLAPEWSAKTPTNQKLAAITTALLVHDSTDDLIRSIIPKAA